MFESINQLIQNTRAQERIYRKTVKNSKVHSYSFFYTFGYKTIANSMTFAQWSM